MIHLKWRIQSCLSFDLEKIHPLSNLGRWQPVTGGFWMTALLPKPALHVRSANGRCWPRLCQNVKSPLPVEIINRLLFKLHYKVGVIINSSPYFSKRMEKISPLMIFLCVLTQPGPLAVRHHGIKINDSYSEILAPAPSHLRWLKFVFKRIIN